MNHNDIRTKVANSDLRIARKNGVMAICNTTHGNIEISFDSGIYTVSNFNNTAIVYALGKKSDIIGFVKSLYVIEG